jgi:predicted transposase YdaD
VFRRIFGVPANAASQLRAVLPPDLAARLDLGRLTPVPASFVDEALKWRYSDLLFTAPLDGRDAYVYLLAEHQSSADPLMSLRRRPTCPVSSSCSTTSPASTAGSCATAG